MTRALVAWLTLGGLLAGPPVQTPVSDRVHVALTDPKGIPFSSATAPTFEVRVDGIDAPVLSAVRATEPLAVVVVVEGMQEMWTTALRKSMRALVASIRQQNPESRVGLMLAPGPAAPTMYSVADAEPELEKAISQFVGGAQTAPVLESILVASRGLEAEKSTRRMVFAFAAGENSNHHVSAPGRVLRELRRAGVSLWAFDMGWSAMSLGPKEERVLASTARLSGGRHEYSSPSALESMLTRVIDVIRSQYLVTYRRPDRSAENPALRVGVRMENAIVLAPSWVSGR
jgi:hypothetical protein